MSRPRLVTIREARRRWLALWKGTGERPTPQMFADELNVSIRTAWRYLPFMEHAAPCRHCRGKGWVLTAQPEKGPTT